MVQELQQVCNKDVVTTFSPESHAYKHLQSDSLGIDHYLELIQIKNNEVLPGYLDRKVLELFAQKVVCLLQWAPELSKIDPRIEEVTRPLQHYSNKIIFEPTGEASLKVNEERRTLSLNSDVLGHLTEKIPKHWLHIALVIFLFHEATHISQGLKSHEDVQKFKKANEFSGSARISAMDLSSDFLAAHTLSLLLTFTDEKSYNMRKYIRWLYEIWCQVCRAMLDSRPNISHKGKQQRIFGHLLMANLITNSYLRNHPLAFGAELWVDWNSQLNWLSVTSGGKFLVTGSSVEPTLMADVLGMISLGNYDEAASGIAKIWENLPRS
jgi:hypothetical protein